jgi:glutaminyl-peptide cyclotransferase
MKTILVNLSGIILLLSIFLSGCNNKNTALIKDKETADTQKKETQTVQSKPIPVYEIEVLKKFPHDKKAFTQGLLVSEGYFYESTGQYGESSLRKVGIEDGKVLDLKPVASEFFAEGLAKYKDMLYQLTWTNGKCFVYDYKTLRFGKSFEYNGEGWGLTAYNDFLIMSDGSNTLKYIKPDDFSIIKTINVRANEFSVYNLNELEIVKDELWANIWMTDSIARINPENGNVNSWLNMSSLRKYLKAEDKVDVINGIAVNPENNKIYVTGKNWPYIFEIKVKE